MDTATVAVLVTWAMAVMSTGVAVTLSVLFGLGCWHLANKQPVQQPRLQGSLFDLVKFGWCPIDRVGRVTLQAKHEGYERVWQYVGERFAYTVYMSPQLTGAVAT